jgi:hypothetical protein
MKTIIITHIIRIIIIIISILLECRTATHKNRVLPTIRGKKVL